MVYRLSPGQERAIADYYFLKSEVRSLRDLAKKLNISVQGASNISLRVLAQWVSEGRIVINPSFKPNNPELYQIE